MINTPSTLVFDVSDRPYNKTMGEWTVLWWNWALSIPKNINPISDETGQYSHVGQRKDVWFLAGRFGREDKSFPHRRCTVPYGRSILFPLINCEANRLEYPHLKNHQDLVDHVTNDVNTVVKSVCFLDRKLLPSIRIASEPQIFNLNICEDNAMGIKHGGVTSTAADGYYVFLKPLPKGEFHLEFEGSCEAGRLSAGATYDLVIQ